MRGFYVLCLCLQLTLVARFTPHHQDTAAGESLCRARSVGAERAFCERGEFAALATVTGELSGVNDFGVNATGTV